MPTFFILFIIFLIWFSYEKKKNSKAIEQEERSFWDREEEANRSRKKDISELPYLVIPDDAFDDIFGASNDTDILNLENRIQNLAHSRMIDLSDYTNTDLKLYYGIGNFQELTQYDQNYLNFLDCLTALGNELLTHQLTNQALAAFQLSLTIGSDKSADYIGLGKCYQALDQPEELIELISSVKQSELDFKERIISELTKILNSYGVEP